MARLRTPATLCVAVAVLFLAAPLGVWAQSPGKQPTRIPARQPLELPTDEKPELFEETEEAAAPARAIRAEADGPDLAGSIIYVLGGQIVAEIPGGARPGENLIVLDEAFRRRGKVVVLKALDNQTFVVRASGGSGAGPGARLTRESENEAISRVIRENRKESYLEFLRLFPQSKHRERVSREMFRLDMETRYPEYPGSVVEGRMRLTEIVGRPVPLAAARVVLDRFVIKETGENGDFRIDGIPKLEEPVRVRLRVKSPRFEGVEEVTVSLKGDGREEVTADLPVKLIPTVLSGQVVDEVGAPLAGAEVWTFPYTMEALTDDAGGYRISRLKRLDAEGSQVGPDQPILGDDYEIYARRRGFSVERARVSAQSHQENAVPVIELAARDFSREPLPSFAVDLKEHLILAPADTAVPQGATPMINP